MKVYFGIHEQASIRADCRVFNNYCVTKSAGEFAHIINTQAMLAGQVTISGQLLHMTITWTPHFRDRVAGQNVTGQNVTDKMSRTKCYVDKMSLDKMSRTKCRGQHVADNMSRTKCSGQNVVDKMSRTKGRGQYDVDKMAWSKCRGQNVLVNFVDKLQWTNSGWRMSMQCFLILYPCFQAHTNNTKLNRLKKCNVMCRILSFGWAQGRHFNFSLRGQKICYFSMPPEFWKIGKNSTLNVVIWRYSWPWLCPPFPVRTCGLRAVPYWICL